jgi:hypothetical protein
MAASRFLNADAVIEIDEAIQQAQSMLRGAYSALPAAPDGDEAVHLRDDIHDVAEGILKGGDWRADGAERRKARESMVTLQRNLERANASLSRAIEIAESTTTGLSHSGVLERLARLEHEQKVRAQWQNDQAAREREKQQRERAASERERGVR